MEFLHELILAIESDSLIDEIGLIPSSTNEIIVMDHKLGISSKILKPLYIYCYTQYQLTFNKYDALPNEEKKQLVNITLGMLIVRGDLPMIYNTRKKLLLVNIISYKQEISFLSILFTLHAKSPSGWMHRKWCLQQLHKQHNIPSDTLPFYLTDTQADIELTLCIQSASIYPKNYFAWTHRIWTLQHLNPLSSSVIFTNEVRTMNDWLRAHPSDHCAVNHIQQVYQLLLPFLNQSTSITPYTHIHHSLKYDNSINLLYNMYINNTTILHTRPGFESLWYSRRFAFQNILKFALFFLNSSSSNGTTIGSCDNSSKCVCNSDGYNSNSTYDVSRIQSSLSPFISHDLKTKLSALWTEIFNLRHYTDNTTTSATTTATINATANDTTTNNVSNINITNNNNTTTDTDAKDSPENKMLAWLKSFLEVEIGVVYSLLGHSLKQYKEVFTLASYCCEGGHNSDPFKDSSSSSDSNNSTINYSGSSGSSSVLWNTDKQVLYGERYLLFIHFEVG